METNKKAGHKPDSVSIKDPYHLSRRYITATF